MNGPRSVAALEPGDRAVVTRIDVSGRGGRRLLALGLSPGCRLCLIRRAPLGDPLMIEASGCILCLRRREAGLVEIEDAA